MNTKVFFLTTSFSFAETHGIGSFKTKSIVLVRVLVLVQVTVVILLSSTKLRKQALTVLLENRKHKPNHK